MNEPTLDEKIKLLKIAMFGEKNMVKSDLEIARETALQILKIYSEGRK